MNKINEMNSEKINSNNMNPKKKFESPYIEVIEFEACNVILSSGGENYVDEDTKTKDTDQFDIKF